VIDPPNMPPGRGFLGDGTEVQVVRTEHADVPVSTAAAPVIGRARPRRIDRLPDAVAVGDVAFAAHVHGDEIGVDLALGDRALGVVGLTLRPGDHLLVAGPGRSGKSSTLALIASLVRRDTDVTVVDLGTGRNSPMRPDAAQLREDVDRLLSATARAVVVVDDADVFDDGGTLVPLVHPGRPGLHVVAAGRADRLRGMFRHWTTEVRRARVGLLLRGEELDGDLFGVRIPRRPVVPWRPGRGWLVCDDDEQLCQVAHGDVAGAPVARCAP
jgi:S-DNA-T family DNA segregation ATPase FtsK/SpoIIIE